MSGKKKKPFHGHNKKELMEGIQKTMFVKSKSEKRRLDIQLKGKGITVEVEKKWPDNPVECAKELAEKMSTEVKK